jgi:hypothetical protein
LAAVPPTCPEIVHSSNDDAAQGMLFALKDSGWPCFRVFPCDGEAWIGAGWPERIRALIREGWIKGDGPR